MDLSAQLKSGQSRDQSNLDPTVPKGKASASKTSPSSSVGVSKTKKPQKAKLKINFKAILNWVILLVIIVMLAYIGYLIYKAYTYRPTSKVEEIKLFDNQDVIRRIDSSITPGNDISTSEEGYGRDNPFERY